MTAWDRLWLSRHAPRVLVEADAAMEAGEPPPCRALVARLRPGCWVRWDDGDSRWYSVGIVTEQRPEAGMLWFCDYDPLDWPDEPGHMGMCTARPHRLTVLP